MSQNKLLPPIYIVGATASGKSELAFLLAKKLDGTIISADSMQIYQGLDIGTAKESKEKRAEVPHKMIDIVAPDAEFSVAEFAKLAREHITCAQQNNRLPIIVGGTGLYFESLLFPLRFAGVANDKSLREKLNLESEQFGAKHMHDKLLSLDPKSAEKLHENDTKRVIRAIEIVITTGKTLAQNSDSHEMPDVIMVGLNTDRQTLYEKINARVDKMFECGLVEEALSQDSFLWQSMQAIGYKEFANYTPEKIETFYNDSEKELQVVKDKELQVVKDKELQSIKDKIKQNTRNYAKRQLTWFRRYSFIKWFDCGDHQNAIVYIENCINRYMRNYEKE